MQRKLHGLTPVLIAAGLLGTLPDAQAQTSVGFRPKVNLSPYVSYFNPDNDYKIPGEGWGGGLRLGIPLANNFELGFSGSHARNSDSGNTVRQTLFGADIAYLFGRYGSLQPYISLGVGGERDKSHIAGRPDRSSTAPYVSGGLGLRYMFTDNLGAMLEYRRVEGFVDKDKWGFRHSSNNYVNLGLMLAFGDAPKPPPPQVAPPPPKPAPPPPPPAKPEAKPEAKAPPPPPPPQRITLQASELFTFDSAQLKAPIPALDDFAAAMVANPDITRVVITGHTDQLGSEAYNRRLSLQRANQVKAYLVGKGVAATRLVAEGAASTRPVVDCKTGTQKQRIDCGAPNRRVEVEPITVPRR